MDKIEKPIGNENPERKNLISDIQWLEKQLGIENDKSFISSMDNLALRQYFLLLQEQLKAKDDEAEKARNTKAELPLGTAKFRGKNFKKKPLEGKILN